MKTIRLSECKHANQQLAEDRGWGKKKNLSASRRATRIKIPLTRFFFDSKLIYMDFHNQGFDFFFHMILFGCGLHIMFFIQRIRLTDRVLC